ITTMIGQVSVQLVGIGSVIIYTAIMSYLLFKLVAVMTDGLRVDKEQEITGLDLIEHDESGYNL
ncbi:MAG: ammonia channel protein, partial [Alteromonadaceae bacterium]